LFNQLSENFLPTPAKSHYVFNMRDISKVFQGMYMVEKDFYESKEQIIKLWCHEVLRVFHDRLIDVGDQTLIKAMLDDQLTQHFQMSYITDCTFNEQDTVFVDFLFDPEGERKVYEEVTDFSKLRDKLNTSLDLYNT
jgi:dynein heavy chain